MGVVTDRSINVGTFTEGQRGFLDYHREPQARHRGRRINYGYLSYIADSVRTKWTDHTFLIRLSNCQKGSSNFMSKEKAVNAQT